MFMSATRAFRATRAPSRAVVPKGIKAAAAAAGARPECLAKDDGGLCSGSNGLDPSCIRLMGESKETCRGFGRRSRTSSPTKVLTYLLTYLLAYLVTYLFTYLRTCLLIYLLTY